MKKRTIKGTQFYGNDISDYGLENGYVDYDTLAKSFDAVFVDEKIFKISYDWELFNGEEYNEEDEAAEVFQWFIISEQGADILQYWTDEIVYYNEEYDIYLWGVTHCGTSWDYVLTDIEIKGDEK